MPWADEGYQRVTDAQAQELWLGVLPENAIVIEVFGRCRIDAAVGMGVLWMGISAAEVRAACLLSRIKPRDWPRVADGVLLMGRVVADIRNAAEAERKRGRK